MDALAGARRLRFHCELEEGSFLGMLRPFRGVEPRVLSDVMEAVRACAPLLRQSEVDRELVSSIWTISSVARAWISSGPAVEPGARAQVARFSERFDALVFLMLEDCAESLGL